MVKLYQVDLEYLQFVDLDNPAIRQTVDRTIDQQLKDIPSSARVVIGTVLWEYSTNPKIKQNFQYFSDRCQRIGVECHFIVGEEKKKLFSDVDNYTFIDFFLLLSHYKCTQTGQQLNDQWYPDNKKFLFLMGKAPKPQRIGLLHRFYKQGMLLDNQAIWSFYGELTLTDFKNCIPNVAEEDFYILTNNYRRYPDNVVPTSGHYGGFPFDPMFYKNTNLSVVSETLIGVPYNTEKIYRAILNRHPFVIAGAAGHSKHLKNMEFDTFDQFFSVPEYSSIVNLSQRLDAVVTNVKNFDPTQEEILQIQSAIEKNYATLQQLVKHHIGIIDQLLNKYGIEQNYSKVLPLVRNSPYYQTWQYYYQTIKDPSWPECATVEDCANLPTHIQQELRTVFKLTW